MTNGVTTSSQTAPARDSEPGFAREFELLEEMVRAIRDSAKALAQALDGGAAFEQTWHEIRDLEHKGDAIARDLFDALLGPKSASTDADALRDLTSYLDDILDAIEAAAARLAIHKIRRALPAAREMGQVMLQCAEELGHALREARGHREVFTHTRALHRLENRGDDLLRRALEELFSGRRSAKDILKWKDICEMLEAGTDRCEDVANVLETLFVRTGAESTLAAGRLVMDVERHESKVAGEAVPLTAKEFDLLHLLLRHQGKVVRRERLLHEVWGEDYFGDSRTLDTHIGWLRRKVEAAGGVKILAVRGIGYRLDLASPDQRASDQRPPDQRPR
jgi:DNA-binding response OmpR family regulator